MRVNPVILVLLACSSAHAASLFVAPLPGGDDASVALTRAIETAVLHEVVGADVVTPRAVDTKVEMDLVKACKGDGDDAACVVDFAQAMGVDDVVRPQLAQLGDLHILTLSLYSGHQAALLAQGQRKATRVEDLVDQVPGLVAEVARAADLRVVVDVSRPAPVLAYSELAGGALVVVASAAAHGIALFAVEPAYEKASFDRAGAETWEAARPFAYAVPVAGYLAGAALIGLGAVGLASQGGP